MRTIHISRPDLSFLTIKSEWIGYSEGFWFGVKISPQITSALVCPPLPVAVHRNAISAAAAREWPGSDAGLWISSGCQNRTFRSRRNTNLPTFLGFILYCLKLTYCFIRWCRFLDECEFHHCNFPSKKWAILTVSQWGTQMLCSEDKFCSNKGAKYISKVDTNLFTAR